MLNFFILGEHKNRIMKNIWFCLMLPIIFCCTTTYSQTKTVSSLDKAKVGIKKYLFETMKDYNSYQPVKWYPLEAIYTNFALTDLAEELIHKADSVTKPISFYLDAMKVRATVKDIDLKTDSIYQSYVKIVGPERKKALAYIDQYDAAEKLFKKKLIGYEITHTYRGKNSYGAYVINTSTFTLNTIFKVVDISDDE